MPQIRILANSTYQAKNGPGRLNRIVIGTKGATGNLFTIWDASNAEPGYILTVLDTTSAVGDVNFNLTLRNGLKIVAATGTCADALVVYDET